MVTDHVIFSNTQPASGKQIQSIADADIARNFDGFGFTETDLRCCMYGMFPNLPELVEFKHEPTGKFQVSFSAPLPDAEQASVHSFLKKQLQSDDIEILVVTPVISPSRSKENFPDYKQSLSFKPFRHRPNAPDFIKEDEEFWFENISDVFEGRMTPRSFDFADNAGHSCFMDGTAFNQLDLRQAVAIFDTVFLTPPLNESKITAGPSFWDTQAISRRDLLRLIEADRVRLILSQLEERCDLGFLREAKEVNPDGVSGRRTAAAFLAADTVETANEYILGRTELIGLIPELAMQMEEESTISAKLIERHLLYPEYARRSCFNALHHTGLMGLGGYNYGNLFGDMLKEMADKDVRVEAATFGHSVHIAHALNSTYIPPVLDSEFGDSWHQPMELIGDRLNFFRSFNSRIAASWARNERMKENRVQVLPPIPLLDIFSDDIDDFIEFTSLSSTRRKGRALLSRLVDLPMEERKIELKKIQEEFKSRNAQRRVRKNFIDNGRQILDLGCTFLGSPVPFPLLSSAEILKLVIKYARRSPKLERIVDAIEYDLNNQLGRNEDLDFLSKVSRVAKLRV